MYFYDNKRHLVCIPYSKENLHLMAKDLGIKRHWFHSGKSPHYDIPKRKMGDISSRCVLASPRQILAIIHLSEDSDFEELIKKKILDSNNL